MNMSEHLLIKVILFLLSRNIVRPIIKLEIISWNEFRSDNSRYTPNNLFVDI